MSDSQLGSPKTDHPYPAPARRGPSNSVSGKTWTVLGISVGVSLLAVLRGLSTPSNPGFYAVCAEPGHVYTVDDHNSLADCIVVNNSRIAKVLSLDETRKIQGLSVKYVPPGAIVLPGLSDSHGHILEYGASRQLPLEGTASIDDTVARVRQYILNTPSILNDTNAFVRGGGWDHTQWPGAAWPTARHLDADPVIRGRPVVLQSKDCHALWVSSRALELSTARFPADLVVDGGIILTDEKGKPSGVLLDNAQELLLAPELTEEDLIGRFNVAMKDALAYGLTSIHDAGLDPASLAFFLRQAERGELPLRIYGMRFFDETAPYWGNTSHPFIGEANGRLTSRSVKIFADGALRTGGSALYEPYADNPSTSGFMRLDADVLFEFIPRFLRDGWQVNVHAIGDRANGIVLDAFDESLKKTGVDPAVLRPRLEHAQLMTKEDMKRLGGLGVIASVQPTHAISDMWYAQDRLGPERVKGLYAFRSIIDSGARLTLGSDFPVETMNPLAGFYAAITRISLDGKSPHGPGGWFPEERLTRVEALRGITIDPAYASFTESDLGSLEVGKRADFVVLSKNIMEIPAEEILMTKTLATVIDGAVVYGKV
ncbi:Amidohydro-3 domain-containing protein [Mycena indigotica]|uniref:Amidohydro-3 domain-containing protein n=1 Tax=Mycena indigotica TaxID=2126181 RepID=A0A8H6T1F8_9AGAR|nr:Amidohydro-3 domain-containing protein [Mycena indigotica]KAF7310265.1 Amidohydro-3 domain-containing protein [Mycena indigotica]